MRYVLWRSQEKELPLLRNRLEAAENGSCLFIGLPPAGTGSQSREWLNDVVVELPYYQEKDSGKDVREQLSGCLGRLKKSTKINWKSNRGTIEWQTLLINFIFVDKKVCCL